MVKKDKNFTADPSGQSEPEAVNQSVDANSPISLAEAEMIMEADEGNIEEQIEREIAKGDKEIAPDLVELKREQAKKQKEAEEATEEAVKGKEELEQKEKEAEGEEIPSKFANKTEAERLKIYKDMEKGYTELSTKAKSLEAKIKELETVNEKIAELENKAIASQQFNQQKLPEYPPDELYYNDPIDYNKKVKAYNEAYVQQMMNPLLGQAFDSYKQKSINEIKEKTQKNLIPYTEVAKEVEDRLQKNPAYFNLYKTKAREFAYNEICSEKLPEKEAEIRAKVREETRTELEEEKANLSNSQIMSSDITTQRRESKPIDFTEQLAETDDPDRVIKGIAAKYKIKHQF